MLSVNVFYRSGNVLQDLCIPVWFPCSYEIYVDVIGKHRSAAHLPCSFMMHVSRVPGYIIIALNTETAQDLGGSGIYLLLK